MRMIAIIAVVCAASQLIAREHQVTGRVLSLNKMPIPGVNVILMGTATATATDANGFFRLNLPEGPVTLAFLFMGQKPLQHSFIIRNGFEYQINATLANKTQTFNSGTALTAELPKSAPRIQGKVVDQDRQELYGVSIRQDKSYFTTITDPEGYFTLPVPAGENTLVFTFPGMKDLQLPVSAVKGETHEFEVILVREKSRYRATPSSARIVTISGANPIGNQ